MKISDFDLKIERGGVFLGDEELDIETKFYSREITLQNRKCTLEIDPPEEDNRINAYLEKVETCVSWVNVNEDLIKKHIANNLLELRNTTWRGKKKVIEEIEFMKKLNIESLSVGEKGAMDLFFSDGKMFEGHSITIVVSAKKRMNKAKIEG